MSALPLSFVIFITYTIGANLFKLGLLLWWTRQLHNRYAARYRASTIFFMMFRPHSKKDMEADFWKDFEPIQRWNLLSNIIIVGGAIVLLFLIILSLRVGK